ncbi:MAG: hypothetical protein WCF84_14305 [Anaerolineae bacterium]
MSEASDFVQPEKRVAGWKITGKWGEWLAATGLSLVLVALTTVPYILGYALSGTDKEFSGVIMNPEDSNSYLAKMQEGYAGEWLYTIPYTSEAQRPEFLGGFYMLLGHLARLSGLSVLAMWHLSRLVTGVLLCLVVFSFISRFIRDPVARWFAFLLALTGSGLGWVLFMFGQKDWLGFFPVDFKMPEAHLFFTLLTFPHFIMGTTLILVSVGLTFRMLETGQLRHALGAGISNFGLSIVYPFLIYLVATILLLNWLMLVWEERDRYMQWFRQRGVSAEPAQLRRIVGDRGIRAAFLGAISMLIPAPLLLYYLWVLRTNPIFQAWDAQSITPSPNPLHYVLAYLPMFVLAAPALRDRRLRGLWLWVLAVGLLVYAPLNPQRRFIEGVQVPLAILAAGGLMAYYLPRLCATQMFQVVSSRPGYSAAGLQRLVLILLLFVFAISNFYILASTSLTAAADQPYPLFRSPAEFQAVRWMGANLPSGAVVLATYEIGSLIPTRTNLKVVIGHWAETPNFIDKYSEIEKFFTPVTSDRFRRDLIASERVDYILYSPTEKNLGDWDIEDQPYLRRIYTNTQITIYAVTRQGGQ